MKCRKLWSVVIVLFGLTSISMAQTLQESTEARNRGAELMSRGDLDGAITELEKCIEISKKVGPEADENREVAEMAVPSLYLQKAEKLVKAKDYEAALKAFETTIAVADKYKNSDIKEKAEKPIPDVYYALGATAFQGKDFEPAISNLNNAVKLDPDMAKAYYVLGAVYQTQKEEEKMEENYKLAIEKAESTNDRSTLQRSTRALISFYNNKGVNAVQGKKYDEAISTFTKLLEIDDTYASAYYALAKAYNEKKSWDQAISVIEKGLTVDKADKSSLNFELGNAYFGKKDNGKACEAYKQVTEGAFVPNAKYQIETVLKCK